MKKEGEIIIILNTTLALAKYDGSLVAGDKVEAYAVIKNKTIERKTGKKEIIIPKGELEVVSHQGDNIYLLKTGEIQETKVVNTFESLNSLFTTEKVVDRISPNSATLSVKDSLKIQLNNQVEIGDPIRKKI